MKLQNAAILNTYSQWPCSVTNDKCSWLAESRSILAMKRIIPKRLQVIYIILIISAIKVNTMGSARTLKAFICIWVQVTKLVLVIPTCIIARLIKHFKK